MQVQEFCSNYQLSFELKGYRPARKVIAKKYNQPSEILILKKKLLVRDWFFYIVWYVRLRKAINELKQKGLYKDLDRTELHEFFGELHKNSQFTIRLQDLNINLCEEKNLKLKNDTISPSIKIYLKVHSSYISYYIFRILYLTL